MTQLLQLGQQELEELQLARRARELLVLLSFGQLLVLQLGRGQKGVLACLPQLNGVSALVLPFILRRDEREMGATGGLTSMRMFLMVPKRGGPMLTV